MGKKRKVHSLTGRIDDRLMMESFKTVKRNRGAAGIDKVSIAMFEKNLDANLASLKRDLKTKGAFVPKPLRRVWIPKDATGKKLRPLGIPAVRDRIAQEVIRRLLEPIFEPLFHDCSFGFRPGRSGHDAIKRVLSYHEEGARITLDADIAGFFDNIPHKLIVAAVHAEVSDGNILNPPEGIEPPSLNDMEIPLSQEERHPIGPPAHDLAFNLGLEGGWMRILAVCARGQKAGDQTTIHRFDRIGLGHARHHDFFARLRQDIPHAVGPNRA